MAAFFLDRDIINSISNVIILESIYGWGEGTLFYRLIIYLYI